MGSVDVSFRTNQMGNSKGPFRLHQQLGRIGLVSHHLVDTEIHISRLVSSLEYRIEKSAE